MHVPRTRRSAADRAFRVSAPRLWNSLPLSIREANSHEAFSRGAFAILLGDV
jgi:hypothetical protein